MEGRGRATPGAKAESNAREQEARRYDSKEGIGRVESGTETENNAGAIIEEQLPRSNYRSPLYKTQTSRERSKFCVSGNLNIQNLLGTPLRCSCIALPTSIIHMEVVNADIAGAIYLSMH